MASQPKQDCSQRLGYQWMTYMWPGLLKFSSMVHQFDIVQDCRTQCCTEWSSVIKFSTVWTSAIQFCKVWSSAIQFCIVWSSAIHFCGEKTVKFSWEHLRTVQDCPIKKEAVQQHSSAPKSTVSIKCLMYLHAEKNVWRKKQDLLRALRCRFLLHLYFSTPPISWFFPPHFAPPLPPPLN